MNRLLQVFAEELNVSIEILDLSSSPDTIEQWDSLAAMRLVAAIEEEFSVQLSTSDILKMTTIENAGNTLREKGVDL